MHRWKYQALIDAGLADEIDSTWSAALRAARKRIKFLGKELQLVKDASKIYDSLAVVDSKEGGASQRNYFRASIHHVVQLVLLVFTGRHLTKG